MYTEYREWPRSSPPIAFAIAIGVGVAIAWIANTSTPNETDIAFKKDQTVFLFRTSFAALLLLFLFRIFLALYLIIQVKLNSNISFIVFLFAWQCVQDVGENRDNWKLFIVFRINAKTFWKLLLLSVHDIFFSFFSFYFLRILMGFSPTLYKFLLLVLVVVHLLFHSCQCFWNHCVRWLLVSNFNYTIHKFGFKYLALQLIENSI